MVRFSIIVPSMGRPSLSATLESIAPQMEPGDELLVAVNDDAPWGNAARQQLMERATGDALLFMDDDDEYVPGVFADIRAAVGQQPERVHIFRQMYANGAVIWQEPTVKWSNVSSQMICVPNFPSRLGRWTDRNEGDLDFLRSTLKLTGEPVWHKDIIALIRPKEG